MVQTIYFFGEGLGVGCGTDKIKRAKESVRRDHLHGKVQKRNAIDCWQHWQN
jgi:hypothetical protein